MCLDQISRQEVGAAKVMGLDTDATCRAWGVAVSQSAGVTANFGTQTKPLLGDSRSRQVAELVLDLENQDGLVPLMDLLALRE